MLVLGFPNAIVLGVLAGILEFIPWRLDDRGGNHVHGGGTYSYNWIWMLALLAVWRILMDYRHARGHGHELEIHPLLQFSL